MFEDEVEAELRKRGGRMSRKELKRLMGGRHRIKNEDFPDLFNDLEEDGKFKVTKRKVVLEPF